MCIFVILDEGSLDKNLYAIFGILVNLKSRVASIEGDIQRIGKSSKAKGGKKEIPRVVRVSSIALFNA